MPEDAGLLRVDEATGLGIALATDGNGRYCRLDPYLGTQLALSEAYRNVAATGARPLAVTNCLNFGSPEDPAVMWQFAEAVRGLADGCAALGVPVTGGNVSFYNQTGTAAIHPTPVVGVLGVHDDVRRRVGLGFPAATDEGGQEPCQYRPARPDRTGVRRLGLAHVRHATWAAARRRRTWTPNGGWPPCSRRRPRTGCWPPRTTCPTAGWPSRSPNPACAAGPGCTVRLPGDPFTWLFSESAGRAIVVPRPGAEPAFGRLAAEHGVPGVTIGTARDDSLTVTGSFTIPLTQLAAVHAQTLPALFGPVLPGPALPGPVLSD